MAAMKEMSTCGELADLLAAQPRDRPVILEKDAEGNGYSPLAAAGEGSYLADSTWSGEIVSPDDYPDAVRVIVLGPVN